MYEECLHCPVLGHDICKSLNYDSEDCKKARKKYDELVSKRQEAPDGWDIVKKIQKVFAEEYNKPIKENDQWQLGYRHAMHNALIYVTKQLLENGFKEEECMH